MEKEEEAMIVQKGEERDRDALAGMVV
jgi:hypothetical protein